MLDEEICLAFQLKNIAIAVKKLSKPSGLKKFEKKRRLEVCLTSSPSHNWIKLGIRMEEKIGAEEPNFAKTRNLLTFRCFGGWARWVN